MNKKKFLKKLEEHLEGLKKDRVDAILSKYEKVIDNEIADGKKEEEVIESLGDVKLIAKLYADEKVNNDEKNDDGKPVRIIDSIINFVDDIFKNMDDKLAKRILQILCLAFIGFFGLWLLYVPFKLLLLVGNGIFSLVFDSYYIYKITSTFWMFNINLCYLILVIWLIIYFINRVVYEYSGKNKKEGKMKSEK